MRVLLLTHSFNSLTQRLFEELTEWGHEVSVEFDINDAVTIEAVELFRPELILAPYLKRVLPEKVWRRVRSIILHPGPRGDRGPSALDWAILECASEWGVTAIEANEELDGGATWAEVRFPMRAASKSSLYRNEVTEAAVKAVSLTMQRMAEGSFHPMPLGPGEGRWRPAVRKSDRLIDWDRDSTESVLRKIRSGDGAPGACGILRGRQFRLFNACAEPRMSGLPGELLGISNDGVCVGTSDAAVRVTHLKEDGAFKLPATMVLGRTERKSRTLPFIPSLSGNGDARRSHEISYEESAGVGHLHFDFYNGAMGVEECRNLQKAFQHARSRDVRVIVLHGGRDFWSNGIHLNVIEFAESPAEESWRNINAMNDLALEILTATDRIVMTALNGSAAAGGFFLALTADKFLMRRGVVLNPHYRNMGNLYGSEYWTYTLARRVGAGNEPKIMGRRLPMGADEAKRLGLVDEIVGGDWVDFERAVRLHAEALARSNDLAEQIRIKTKARAVDEARKPLAEYRSEELEKMRLNFFGCDPSYHVARSNFVRKIPHSRTPFSIASHRRRLL